MWGQPPSAVRRAQHGESVAPLLLLLLLLRRIARRNRLNVSTTRWRTRTVPHPRRRRTEPAARTEAARLPVAAILPVEVGLLAESLQMRLVRGRDQPPLILRRIVDENPVLIFFLVI